MIQCKILTLSSCEATKGILMKMKKFLDDVMQNTRDLFPANEGLLREATSVALKEKAAVFLSADFVSLVLQGSPAKPLSYFRYLFQSIKTIFHHHIFIQSSIDQF